VAFPDRLYHTSVGCRLCSCIPACGDRSHRPFRAEEALVLHRHFGHSAYPRAAILSVPLNWKRAAAEAPPIHDITTDLAEPPRFVAILPFGRTLPNPAEYGGASVALAQQSAYPDIKTLLLDMPAEQAFPLVQETVKRLGWKVVAAVPEEGRIEATDTTFWFGFTDDIVVRVTPAGHRSLVDIRSVSRVGRSDAGTNAARIRRFLAAFHPRG